MDNTKDIKSKRLYVCCPHCSKVLLQGELVKNTIVKCENCRRRIFIEIEDGKTVASRRDFVNTWGARRSKSISNDR